MRTETINVYHINELDEHAQRRAWENGPDFSGDFDDDYRATLAAFERVFDIKVYNYNIGGIFRPSWAFVKAGAAVECPEGRPLRLARYMWNNYADDISKGRYYSTRGRWENGKYQYKCRHSRVTFDMDGLPLTGCYCDEYILRPILDCLRYKRFFDTYDELIDACLCSFFGAWEADIEYTQTFDYFADWADANEVEFLENGDIFK